MAIVILGPEKLPGAIVEMVKIFRAIRKSVDDAKETINQEINIEDLKKDVIEYKNEFLDTKKSITESTSHIYDLNNPKELFKEYEEDKENIKKEERKEEEENNKEENNKLDIQNNFKKTEIK